jgi:hypothetical protein
MLAALLLLVLLAAEGRPLFYWGARPPVIAVEAATAESVEAQVTEVHAAREKDGVVLRFTFDRPVASVLYLPDRSPVSGRLRATLYVDADDDRRTGWSAGESDLRTGAEQRLDLGVVSLGADPEEKRAATALVTASLFNLDADGRQHVAWRADDDNAPRAVSAHGDWVEVRLPASAVKLSARARLILASGPQIRDGRVAP